MEKDPVRFKDVKRKMSKNRFLCLGCVLLPMVGGGISAALTADAMQQFGSFKQPPLSPPGWLFPVVWTILYILMGIASYLILVAEVSDEDGHRKKKTALALYVVQLVFNFCWSPIFFNANRFFVAFFWLVLMWGMILSLIVLSRKLQPMAATLLVPYFLWTTFAGYLNLSIALLNH